MTAAPPVTFPAVRTTSASGPVRPLNDRATLQREERLRGRSTFAALIRSGRGMNENPFRLIGLAAPRGTNPSAPLVRIGFAVPKRHLPLAVERNRMRRLMREAWRLDRLPHLERAAALGVRCDWLLIFQGPEPVSWSATRNATKRLFERWLKEQAPMPDNTAA